MMILWRGETPVEEGFRAGLTAHGIDADIIVRNINRDKSLLPGFIAEARETKPDLVYTWGTGITLATAGTWDKADPIHNVTELPIVYVMVSAPLRTGVKPPDDAPPRPNVTGVSHIPPLRTLIEAIKAYMPLDRLGVIYNPQEVNSVANIAELRALGRIMGFALSEAPAPMDVTGKPDPAAISGLVARLAEEGAQVLYIGPDNFIGNHRAKLTSAGIAHGIPCFTATELEIRDGDAMFGLVSRYNAVGRMAAEKAARILVNGELPSTIPMETLERFSYIVRLPIALHLKNYPPLNIIDFAEIIQ